MRFQSYEKPLTLFDLVGAVFRYKWRFMLVSVLTLICCIAGVFLFPRKYESEAKLFVRLGRASTTLDPTAIGQTISIQESRESEMNSILDLLGSRGLAEQVAERVGAERILEKHSWLERTLEGIQAQISDAIAERFPEDDQPVAEGELTGEALKQQKRRELAIKQLLGNLKINSPKKSTTIGVTFRGGSPTVAHDVVEAVIDCYQVMHIDANRSGGTLDFFNEQFVQQEEALRASEGSLREAKNENAIVTMKGKQESLQTEITDVKKMQLATMADMEAAKARVLKLQRNMDELPKEVVSEKTSGFAVASTDAMRDRLYQLEIQEKDLESKFVSSHPELQKVREQLRNAREIMDEQPKDREQSVLAVNPVRLEIQNELLLAEATVASLSARLTALDQLENELSERLSKVNELEVVSEELQRKIDIARENHRNYARKLEESRINAALDTQALSNVSVVSPPSLRYKAVSPNRPMLAVLAAMFSVGCGFAVALLSDYSKTARETQRIRDAERVYYLSELERETAEAKAAAIAANATLSARKNIELNQEGNDSDGKVPLDSAEADDSQKLAVRAK